MKTFIELFSKEEFLLTSEIQSVLRIIRNDRFSGNYEPYQIKANGSLKQLSFDTNINNADLSVCTYLKTLKLAYAIQVWEIARDLTNRRYHDFCFHEWISENSSIKKLKFTSRDRKSADKYFLQKLKDVCNDEKITVSEGSIFTRDEYVGFINSDELLLEVSIAERKITDEMMDKIRRQFSNNEKSYSFDKHNIRFSFDAISDFFVQTDEHLLSLLNAKDGAKQVASIDRELFDQAERLNLEGMLKAIENGANINAIDEDGQTTLTKAIKASRYDFIVFNEDNDRDEYVENNPDYSDEEKIAVAEKLLSLGADINLFGYDGLNGLMFCAYQHNPVLMKFMLNKGANPNFNYFPDDDDDDIYSSSVLENMYLDYNLIEDKDDEKELDEMVKMLEEAGAKA
ncbi:MAG: hypothetical protein POELPBGB_03038 [Bacteroidia bacterium]|nr:hypothetical protein [Bacteroidia bacterium]